jgi:hypothetical protein
MSEEKKIEGMKNLKSKGFARFLLEMGFLRFGLPVTVIYQLITFIGKYGVDFSNIGQLFTGSNLISFLIFLTLESVIFAVILWFYIDRYLSKAAPLGRRHFLRV